jgi:hypothetical protein
MQSLVIVQGRCSIPHNYFLSFCFLDLTLLFPVYFRLATNNLWCPFSGNSSIVGECVLDPSIIVNPPKITTNTTNTTNTPSLIPPATTAPTTGGTLAGTTTPVTGTLPPATIATTIGGTIAGTTAPPVVGILPIWTSGTLAGTTAPVTGTLPPTSIAPTTTTMNPTIKKPTKRPDNELV